jgi:hypothetical protein
MSSGAPVELGTPIRYPSAALLCIDSEDSASFLEKAVNERDIPFLGFRNDNNKSTEILINKQAPLMFGYMTRVALTEVNFAWNIPNVNDLNANLTLAIWDMDSYDEFDGLQGRLAGYRRININPAFYTLPQLMQAIKNALNQTVPSFTSSDPFDSFTQAISWDVSFSYLGTQGANCTIQMIADTPRNLQFQIVPSNTTYNVVEFDASGSGLSAKQDDLTYMLGLSPSVPTQLSANKCAAYKYIASGYASMQFTPYIDIVSNILTKNQNVADNDSSFMSGRNKLARIYLSDENFVERIVTATYDASGVLTSSSDNAVGTRPFTFRREFKFPKQIQWNTTENVDLLDLQVVDFQGRVLYQLDTRSSIEEEDSGVFVCTAGNSTPFQFTLQATEV